MRERLPQQDAAHIVLRNGATAAPETRFGYCAAKAEHLVLAGPFGWASRRGGELPCHAGSRPSMAALTRSGARKASEIVIFTLRTLEEQLMPLSRLNDGFEIELEGIAFGNGG